MVPRRQALAACPWHHPSMSLCYHPHLQESLQPQVLPMASHESPAHAPILITQPESQVAFV
jgi:hypothetical protein